jgi:hypothetical protein
MTRLAAAMIGSTCPRAMEQLEESQTVVLGLRQCQKIFTQCHQVRHIDLGLRKSCYQVLILPAQLAVDLIADCCRASASAKSL